MADHRDGYGGVVCGACSSGDVFFLTCNQGGCSWSIGFECRSCGELHPIPHANEPCNTDNADVP